MYIHRQHDLINLLFSQRREVSIGIEFHCIQHLSFHYTIVGYMFQPLRTILGHICTASEAKTKNCVT